MRRWLEKIGQIVHAFHIPLIVDEAHGAHFSFYKGFPSGAVKAGADIVVHTVQIIKTVYLCNICFIILR